MSNLTVTPAGVMAAPTVGDNIANLELYVPGKPIEEVERELGITGIVKLASNENSLGPSPRALAALRHYVDRVHVYPDANSFALKTALAQHIGVTAQSLVFGNGSDDVIHLLGLTFLQPGDEIIQPTPSFVRYESAGVLNQAVIRSVPLTPDWRHDIPAMKAAVTDKTRMIFVCNPNNPTGTIVTRDEMRDLLDGLPERVVVVIDEAYFEYAADDPLYPESLEYVREGRNVAVLRTFSKAYGLAGLRIGYGVMRPEMAVWLERTREPFNVNTMAQVGAQAALDDRDHLNCTLQMNRSGLDLFYKTFAEMGLTFTPSHANFIWVDVKRDCKEVFRSLLLKGVITRTGDIFGAPTHLRVTVGTADENGKFLRALRDSLAE